MLSIKSGLPSFLKSMHWKCRDSISLQSQGRQCRRRYVDTPETGKLYGTLGRGGTGSEKLRNSLLKKQLPTATIVAAFDLIHKYGIKSKAYNMLGLPGETCDDIEETIRLNKLIKPDLKNITIFRPYPGTELYEYCKSKNWIADRKVSGYWEESILDQPSLAKEDTYFYQLLFYYENKAPWLARIARLVNRVRITPRISLFRLLHNKSLMYSVYALIKR